MGGGGVHPDLIILESSGKLLFMFLLFYVIHLFILWTVRSFSVDGIALKFQEKTTFSNTSTTSEKQIMVL